jgi:hypothetical protein
MENVICPKCHSPNIGTTTLWHCQYCGEGIRGVPRSTMPSVTPAAPSKMADDRTTLISAASLALLGGFAGGLIEYIDMDRARQLQFYDQTLHLFSVGEMLLLGGAWIQLYRRRNPRKGT